MSLNNGMTLSSSRTRRKRSVKQLCWLCAIAVVLVYSLFNILDILSRDIHDMYSPSVTTTHHNTDSLLLQPSSTTTISDQSDATKISSNDKMTPPRSSSQHTSLQERIAQRQQERREQRRKKRSEQKSSSMVGLSSSTSPSSRSAFDYRQPVQRTDATLPEPTNLYPEASNIIAVLSARENLERRRVIRETWGKDHAVYFVVGGPPVNANQDASEIQQQDQLQEQLENEQELHQDLIDTIHPDSYASLPFKLRFAYQWILANVPNANWISKVDDDTVVRVDTLDRMVLRALNPEEPIVVGRIIEASPVATTGKWAESKYPHKIYPYWPQGSCGHVVSRAVAEYIAMLPSDKLVYYQGEDTSVGIWLDESPLPVIWYNSEYFQNHGKCQETEWLVIGHQVTPEQMQQCFNVADEWSEEDMAHKTNRFWHMTTLKQKKGTRW